MCHTYLDKVIKFFLKILKKIKSSYQPFNKSQKKLQLIKE